MADPLSLLREFVSSGRIGEVALAGDRVDFGGKFSFPKNAATGYKSQQVRLRRARGRGRGSVRPGTVAVHRASAAAGRLQAHPHLHVSYPRLGVSTRLSCTPHSLDNMLPPLLLCAPHRTLPSPTHTHPPPQGRGAFPDPEAPLPPANTCCAPRASAHLHTSAGPRRLSRPGDAAVPCYRLLNPG